MTTDRVLSLLTCGGTIAMTEGADGVRRPADSSVVADLVTSLWRGPVTHVRVSELDSAEAAPSDWDALVRGVLDAPSRTVLITHGTDTLAWSAAALAASGVGRERTIVLTAANTPLGEPDSDATTNLSAALGALRVLGPGVWVVFSGVPGAPGIVTEGGFARKLYAGGPCFADAAGHPYATISGDVMSTNREQRRIDPAERPGAFTQLVDLVRVWPGGLYLDDPTSQLVVVELYACGTCPQAVVDAVSRWSEAGRTVVVVALAPSQGGAGEYESTRALRATGAHVRFDLTAELAVCSLMRTKL